MSRRLSSGLLLAALPTLALAQVSAPGAPICDGSAIRRVERARATGGALMAATAVADLAAILTIPRDPAGVETAKTHFRFIAASTPIVIAGFAMANRARLGVGFWDQAIARLKVGETRSTDIGACLHRPDAAISTDADEQWTYVVARPAALGGGAVRTLRLTFREGVLTNVQRAEVSGYASMGMRQPRIDPLDRHSAFCQPPIAVFADPFPVPSDSTPAAAAMARAQADADAAARSAAAATAYAICMAGDGTP